jgi:hypothetical protein
MRRFIPFVFATAVVLVAIRMLTVMHAGTAIRAKLAEVDWRVLGEWCEEPVETPEVTA